MTLIEVMIAIIIFWIWVLVVMNMITSNIARLYDIKERDQAVTFAKEAMDIVYHIRDSNLERGQYRNCATIVESWTDPERCWPKFYDSGDEKMFTVYQDHEWTYVVEEHDPLVQDVSETELYLHEWTISIWAETLSTFWFDHESAHWWVNGDPQGYYRTIEFRPVQWTFDTLDWSNVIDPDSWSYSDLTDTILEITVRVLYQRNSATEFKQVVLQSIIWNIR